MPQPNTEDRTLKLYNNLKGNNYEVGEYSSFKEHLANDKDRRQLYDVMSEEYSDMPSYDQFSSDLGFGEAAPVEKEETRAERVAKREAREAAAAKSLENTAMFVPREEGRNGTTGKSLPTREKGTEFQAEKKALAAEQQAAKKKQEEEAEAAKQAEEVAEEVAEQPKEEEKAPEGGMTDQQRMAMSMKVFNAQMQLSKQMAQNRQTTENMLKRGQQQAPVSAERRAQISMGNLPTTVENGKEVYILPDGNTTDNKVLAVAENSRYEDYLDVLQASSINNQLSAMQKNAETGLEKSRAEVDEKYSYLHQGGLFNARAAKHRTDPDEMRWRIVRDGTDELYKVIDEASRQGETNFFAGAWRGIRKSVTDKNTWMFGAGDMQQQKLVSEVIKKWDKREKLSSSEQALLDYVAMNAAVMSEYADKLGRGYKAGEVTGESLPFMIEMFVNPAAGVGEALAGRFARYAVKNFGKKLMTRFGTKVGRYVLKSGNMLTRGAGDVLGATAMTATTGLPSVIANTYERMAGSDFRPIVNQKTGKIELASHRPGESAGAALRKAFIDQDIERWSEMFGAYLEPATGAVSGAFMRGMEKYGMRGLTEALERFRAGDFYKGFKNLTERTRWNGVFEEYSEEVVGNIANALLVGDQTLDTDKDTGVFNLSNNIDTFLGVGLMSMFFTTVNMAGMGWDAYNSPSRRSRKLVNTLEQVGYTEWGDDRRRDWFNYMTIVRGNDMDATKEAITNIVTDRRLTTEQKRVALQYAAAVMQNRGADMAVNKLYDEDLVSETEQLMQNAYRTGYDMGQNGEDNRDKWIDTKNLYDDAVEKLEQQGMTTELMEEIRNNPFGALANLQARVQRGAASQELYNAVSNYVQMAFGYNGLRNGVDDAVNSRVMESDAQVDAITRLDENSELSGEVVPVKLIDDDEDYYLVIGNPVVDEDGSVNAGETNGLIILKRGRDGTIFTVDPNDIERVGAPQDAERLKVQRGQEIQDAAAKEFNDAMKGVLPFNIGDVYHGMDAVGDEGDITILGPAVDEATGQPIEDEVIVQMGEGAQPITLKKEQVQVLVDRANKARVGIGVNLVNPESVGGTSAPAGETPGGTPGTAPTTEPGGGTPTSTPNLDLIPKDESGEPIYEQSPSVDVAYDGLVEQAKGNEEIAQRVAQRSLDKAKEELEEAEEAEPEEAAKRAEEERKKKEAAEAEAKRKKEIEEEKKKAEAAKAAEEARKQEETQGEKEPEKPKNEGAIGIASDARVEEIKKRIADKIRGRLNAGWDPELMALGMELAAAYIDRGIKSFADFARQMIADLGDAIRPYLKSFYESARNHPDLVAAGVSKELTPSAEVQEFDIDNFEKESEEEHEPTEEELLEGVPDWTLDSPREARERGYRNENGYVVWRQKPITKKVEGDEVTVRFTNSGVQENGRLVLVEQSELQGSHRLKNLNVRHFIPDAQPKAQTPQQVADRANRSVLNAQNLVPQDTVSTQSTPTDAYRGAPVVNSRGEAIQGNGRVDMFRLVYSEHPEQAERYKKFLKQHAKDYGMTAEDVDKFERPVLVRMLDVDDDRAVELGQYGSEEMESGGKVDIDTQKVANKFKEKEGGLGIFVRVLLKEHKHATGEEYDINELIDANGLEALKWLSGANKFNKQFISQSVVQNALDGRGNLTPTAKRALKDILFRSIFGDAAKSIESTFYSTNFPDKARKALLTTMVRDFQSPKGERLAPHIIKAIEAYAVLGRYSEFVKSKDLENALAVINENLNSADMFSGESPLKNYSNFALHMAALFRTLTQNELKGHLDRIFNLVQGKAQQESLLADEVDNTPRTLVEAVKEVLNIEIENNNEQSGSSDVDSGAGSSAEGGEVGHGGNTGGKSGSGEVRGAVGTTGTGGLAEGAGEEGEVGGGTTNEGILGGGRYETSEGTLTEGILFARDKIRIDLRELAERVAQDLNLTLTKTDITHYMREYDGEAGVIIRMKDGAQLQIGVKFTSDSEGDKEYVVPGRIIITPIYNGEYDGTQPFKLPSHNLGVNINYDTFSNAVKLLADHLREVVDETLAEAEKRKNEAEKKKAEEEAKQKKRQEEIDSGALIDLSSGTSQKLKQRVTSLAKRLAKKLGVDGKDITVVLNSLDRGENRLNTFIKLNDTYSLDIDVPLQKRDDYAGAGYVAKYITLKIGDERKGYKDVRIQCGEPGEFRYEEIEKAVDWVIEQAGVSVDTGENTDKKGAEGTGESILGDGLYEIEAHDDDRISQLISVRRQIESDMKALAQRIMDDIGLQGKPMDVAFGENYKKMRARIPVGNNFYVWVDVAIDVVEGDEGASFAVPTGVSLVPTRVGPSPDGFIMPRREIEGDLTHQAVVEAVQNAIQDLRAEEDKRNGGAEAKKNAKTEEKSKGKVGEKEENPVSSQTEDRELTKEEVDSAEGIDPTIKTMAKAWLDGQKNAVTENAYQLIKQYVRSLSRNSSGDSGDANGAHVGSTANGATGEGSGQSGVAGGQVDTEGSGETLPGNGLRGENSPVRVATTAGGPGDRGVSEQEPSALDGSDTAVQTGAGGERGGNGSTVPNRGGRQGSRSGVSKTNAGREGKAGSRKDNGQRLIDEALSELGDILKSPFKMPGDEGNNLYSAIPFVSALGVNGIRVMAATVKLGYGYLLKGYYKFVDWKAQMSQSVFPLLKNATKAPDEDIDRFIVDMWDTPFEIDGEVKNLCDWAKQMELEQLRSAVRKSNEEKRKIQLEQNAKNIPVELTNIDNIREALPFLLPEQQEDVQKAEIQFFDESHNDKDHAYGKGYMFTNGTGTGKTYTGAGIIKRFLDQGKKRILIVTANGKKIEDWVDDSKNLGIEATALKTTKDRGKGVIVTQYADLYQNFEIYKDEFDLIVYDESHKLMENKDGLETATTHAHFLLSNRDVASAIERTMVNTPLWVRDRAIDDEVKKYAKLLENYNKEQTFDLEQQIKNLGGVRGIENKITQLRSEQQELRKQQQVALKEAQEDEAKVEKAKKDVEKTKVVFLSATPFNTAMSLDYAEGYIFAYPSEEGKQRERRSLRDDFLMNTFGSSYVRSKDGRVGMLKQQFIADPEAASEEEIAFSNYLQETLNTMSGRALDSEWDYSREFPKVDFPEADMFNKAVDELSRGKYKPLKDYFKMLFDYNTQTAFFEIIKADQAIERAKEHIAHGRKVVIFHRRMETKADIYCPFDTGLRAASADGDEAILALVKSFRQEFSKLLTWESKLDYTFPNEKVMRAFASPEETDKYNKEHSLWVLTGKGKEPKIKSARVGAFNGKESEDDRAAVVNAFNDDNSKMDVLIVQIQSGKEGISLHDTTGKKQRAQICISLPQSPIEFIQAEGRIYRVGNQSNAIFEYPLLGVDLELASFAIKINGRSQTTENLALGGMARGLRDSIARAALGSRVIPVQANMGTGGKALDDMQKQKQSGYDDALNNYAEWANEPPVDEGADFSHREVPDPIGYKMAEFGAPENGEKTFVPDAGTGTVARYVSGRSKLWTSEPRTNLFAKLVTLVGGSGRKVDDRELRDIPTTGSNKVDVYIGRADQALKGFNMVESSGRVVLMLKESEIEKFEKSLEEYKQKRGNFHTQLAAETILPANVMNSDGEKVHILVYDIKTGKNIGPWKNASKKLTDLSGIEDVNKLYQALRDVQAPPRDIDQVERVRKRVKKYIDKMKKIPFVTKRKDWSIGKMVPSVADREKDLTITFLPGTLTPPIVYGGDITYSYKSFYIDYRNIAGNNVGYIVKLAQTWVMYDNWVNGREEIPRGYGVGTAVSASVKDDQMSAVVEAFKVFRDAIGDALGKNEMQIRNIAQGMSENKITGTMSIDEFRQAFDALNQDNAEIKALADKVFDTASRIEGMQIKVVPQSDMPNPNVMGLYMVKNGQSALWVSEEKFNSIRHTDAEKAQTIVHELIHSVTTYYLDSYQKGMTSWMSEEQQQACREIMDVYKAITTGDDFRNYLRTHSKVTENAEYGLTNTHEMMAELANPVFRSALKAKKLWKQLINGIKKILGIDVTGEEGSETTAFDVLSHALDVLMDGYNSEAYNNWTSLYGGNGQQNAYVAAREENRITIGDFGENGISLQHETERNGASRGGRGLAAQDSDGVRNTATRRGGESQRQSKDGIEEFDGLTQKAYNDFLSDVRREAKKFAVPFTVLRNEKELIKEDKKRGHDTSEERARRIGGVFYPGENRVYLNPKASLIREGGNMEKAKSLARATIFHECVAHFGLRNLLGHKFDTFCDKVWKGMNYANRRGYVQYVWDNNYDEKKRAEVLSRLFKDQRKGSMWADLDVDEEEALMKEALMNEDLHRGAADEYTAFLAEKIFNEETLTKDERSVWRRFANWIRNFFGLKYLTDEDIAEAIRISRDIHGGYESATDEERAKAANNAGGTANAIINQEDLNYGLEQFVKQQTDLRERARREQTQKDIGDAALTVADALNLDDIDLIEDVNDAPEGARGKKGFYDTRTGRIAVIVPNNYSRSDVERTVLHEAVTHYGLRQLLGDHFNDFLRRVVQAVPEETRRKIMESARENGWNVDRATEEYLGELCDGMDWSKDPSLWSRIRHLFHEMLRRAGFEHLIRLSDNDLRYMLWKSRENLEGRDKGAMGVARDIVKQRELKVGDYEEDDLLYRPGETDNEAMSRAQVRDAFEAKIKSGVYQTREAMLDHMASLKEAMELITKGKYKHVEDIPDAINPYLGENRLSSVNDAEVNAFQAVLFAPLYKEVRRIAKSREEREQLVDYLMSKHGLERNEYMARRDAEKEYDEYMKVHPKGKMTFDDFLKAKRKKDYAGLCGLWETMSTKDAEEFASAYVKEYESEHDTSTLWELINRVNDAILSKSLETGLLGQEMYDYIKSMYQYYIPLRGFDETTSSEAYAYLPDRRDAFNRGVMKAHGRRSKADDPFVNLESMAASTIVEGNRNALVKQRFYNFVMQYPSDLVSVAPIWLQFNKNTQQWEAQFPTNIADTDSPEEVERKLKEWEEQMAANAEEDPSNYRHGREARRIPYKVVTSQDLHQHQVLVRVDGDDYILTVNGNPRLAQAVNGKTNPDNQMTGSVGAILNLVGGVNRGISAIYTTLQPDFIVSNYMRDMIFSNSMTWVKEGPRYAARFTANCIRFNPLTIFTLLDMYRRQLNKGYSLPKEYKVLRQFREFMENGGETGYVRLMDLEDIRKRLKKKFSSFFSNDIVKVIGELGRGVEMSARFAAFVTSRDMGRDIARSIWDAKEVSVNFNKKGAGDKFLAKTGQTKAGNVASFVSGAGRTLYIFWNASLQGTFGNFFKYGGRHPLKFATMVAGLFALGLMKGLRGGGDGDDDDDKEKEGEGYMPNYYDVPSYTRRSNIVFKGPKNTWLKYPLAIEFRTPYGLGELLGSCLVGKDEMTADGIMQQLCELCPVDVLEGQRDGEFSFITPIVPSSFKTWYEAEKNVSFTGVPIYKDTPFNKEMPNWTKAYGHTNKDLINLSAVLNEWTGGDNKIGEKGKIDLNPAYMEYMLRGYLPFFTLINQLDNLAHDWYGNKEFDWRDVPLVNRVVSTGDETMHYRQVNNKYYKLKDEHDKVDTKVKKYNKQIDKNEEDAFKYAEKIDFLQNSKEYKRYKVFEEYRKDIDRYDKKRKEAVEPEEVKFWTDSLNILKEQLVNDAEQVSK